jgi:hypothetical protein
MSSETETAEGGPAKFTKRASEEKWGRSVIDRGFVIVPALLLRAQRRLRITPTQLAVLIHLVDIWWHAGQRPFPSKRLLSERVGLGPRQVQRCIAQLESAGYLQRVERIVPIKGKTSNEYDLTGLVARLQELEPEFRRADEEARRVRAEVRRPGFRKGRNVQASTIAEEETA